MIIDTESEEGRALVALAKFARDVLDNIIDADVILMAVEHELVEPDSMQYTALAKLPEGL